MATAVVSPSLPPPRPSVLSFSFGRGSPIDESKRAGQREDEESRRETRRGWAERGEIPEDKRRDRDGNNYLAFMCARLQSVILFPTFASRFLTRSALVPSPCLPSFFSSTRTCCLASLLSLSFFLFPLSLSLFCARPSSSREWSYSDAHIRARERARATEYEHR